ncbi:hypothetical protein ABZZ36_40440 [Actinacidiphila glaucinigra]|uniref:hypothetical protein n=1 Tax=Actinacidiphila glaucinigra TaxID=235986 RepID=UPI0033A5C866
MPSTASQPAQYRAVYIDMHTTNPLQPLYATLQEAQERCEGDLTDAWTGDGQLDLTWQPDTEPVSRWRMMMRTALLRDAVSTGYEVVIADSDTDAALEASEIPSP